MYLQLLRKSKNIVTVVFVQLVTSLSCIGQISGYSADFTNGTLAIYKTRNDTIIPHGTGFLIYNYKDHDALIVTCSHLLKNDNVLINLPVTDAFISALRNPNSAADIKATLQKQFNGDWIFNGRNFLQKVPLIRNKTFYSNDSLDIAMIKWPLISGAIIIAGDTIPINKLLNVGVSFTKSVTDLPSGVSVYFIGFPFGIGTYSGYENSGSFSDAVSNPVVRSGILSWHSSNYPNFLIDAFSFGGNSGSPIVTQVSAFAPKPFLIGMVLGHLDDPGCVNCNSGLARCIDIKSILQLRDSIK
ncbi:MAG TPA: trypsin-like peptidase domain-containing protein [Puia sp.]|jgi:hypothetical protein|nr:trypsin-like peptidase domain-containing protein [Puia sp.]